LIGNLSIVVIGLGIVLDSIHGAGRRASAILLFVLVAGGVCSPVAAQTGDTADALSQAARKGDAAAVKKLLDEGVAVNTRFRYDRTALSFAADRGHVDVVKVLIDRGADPNIKDTFYGATPLAWAVSPAMDRTPQHTEVVRLLLAHGGIPAAALSDALAAATRNKLDDVVALLEKAGAKPK
jgi:ankyrin repeat protein